MSINSGKGAEFQRLMQDCRTGKIDRVLVKSISRFARNNIDCLEAVRELKQLGVAVEFEKEHIDTSKMGSEMLLSMLSAAAQEESLSISKNLKWSYQRRMRSGDFITSKAPLGYFFTNNSLIPDPQEIPIVEYIFGIYLAGHGIKEIADDLNSMEIGMTRKKRGRWHHTIVRYILSNEKYIGDSLVQKKYTANELPFKQKLNKGQHPQYYITNSHPAIISREIFESVQKLLKQKLELYPPRTEIQQFPLSHMLKCGECGSTFHRHARNSDNQWVCYKHFQSKELCPIGFVLEKEVFQSFLTLYNKLLENKDTVLKPMLSQLQELESRTLLAKPKNVELNQKISELVKQNHSLARLLTKECIDSAIFIERSNQNNQKITELRGQLCRDSDTTSLIIDKTKLILDVLDGSPPMLDFDPSLFKNMVNEIIIYPQKFSFQLINEMVLEEGRSAE